jgi:hypothetical protein
MSRKRKAPDDSFWSSYADLSTGTMVIFLLLLVSLAVQMRVQQETQSAKVEELRSQVQIILGTRARLADAIKQSAGTTDAVKIDPVTAQLVFAQSDNKIAFTKGSAELNDAGKRFLGQFVPTYLCALRRQECKDHLCPPKNGTCDKSSELDFASCPRLDPTRPQGVRRILVTGHADLLGSGDKNLRLSAARATAVVNHSLSLLERAENLPPDCQADQEKVRQYAQERFMALGAGYVEHCRDSQAPGSTAACSDLPETKEANYRRVTFELELTGADMTGLVLDLIALKEATGGLKPETDGDDDRNGDGELLKLRDDIAQRCWEDPSQYHDCARFIDTCLPTESATEEGETSTEKPVFGLDCTKVKDKAQRSEKLQSWLNKNLPESN